MSGLIADSKTLIDKARVEAQVISVYFVNHYFSLFDFFLFLESLV
jgi:hypothetical protein